jgi:E3 ubiquitin-protein ligase UBR7
MAATLTEYLDSQQELEKEAALALPYSFSRCTYSFGYIRQAVYLCITCASRRGICSSCSIACHTDHEQLELFPKRRFRCDCPTSSLTQPCSLHKQQEAQNEENEYGQNFDSKFCRCGRPYDAKLERETMIQCLACEVRSCEFQPDLHRQTSQDWFHESCLNLRSRPPSRFPSPELSKEDNCIAEVEQDDASRSDTSLSGLPPPLITAEDYDALVCRSCVSRIPILEAWAGTPGVAMVVRESPDSSWKIIGRLAEDNPVDVDGPGAISNVQPVRVEQPGSEHTNSTEFLSENTCSSRSDADTLQGKKRSLFDSSPSADGPSVKRSRTSGMSGELPQRACLAPTRHPISQAVFVQDSTRSLGEGDIFLSGDWRKRWCPCDSCLPELRKHPFLLEEEETYEPPEDPDSREL